MVAASHIVCAFVALCGAASAAPTVTYDQRQNGEFNLQVEADGVAVVLLPGGSASDLFDMKKNYALKTGDKWQQIFGRRSGVNVSFKKKKPQKCTTVEPEKPNTQSPSVSLTESSSSPYPSSPYPSSSSASSPSPLPAESTAPSAVESPAPSPDKSPVPIPSPQQENPANVESEDVDIKFGADHPLYIRPGTFVEDPYSVTPDTPDIFPQPETDDDDDNNDDAATVTDSVVETTAVEAEQKSVAVDVKTVEKPAAVASEAQPSPTTAVTGFEEKPASVSSSDEKTVEKSTVEADNKAHDAAVDVVAVPTTQTRPETDGTAVGADAKPLHTENGPATTTVVKAGSSPDTKKPNEQPAVEMVAMKTMEKPTSSEPLKVQTKKQQPSTAVPVDEKPAAEMIAMKTIDKPSTSVDAATMAVEKSGITKPVGVSPTQADAVKGSSSGSGSSEAAVSRSKPTEMVAVKTVESPGATATTAKNVVSVRTMIRPGNPKTASSTSSSNVTSMMRKVGDRKPLPLVTLEVSHPKVVV